MMEYRGKDGSAAMALGAGVMARKSFLNVLSERGEKIVEKAMKTGKNPVLSPAMMKVMQQSGPALRGMRRHPVEQIRARVTAKLQTGQFKPGKPEDMGRLLQELEAEMRQAPAPGLKKGKRNTLSPGK